MPDFGSDGATVNLEWIQESGVSYNVSVIPPVAVRATGSTSVQLTVGYNTLYNVSVIAKTHCDHTTTVIGLIYGEFSLIKSVIIVGRRSTNY